MDRPTQLRLMRAALADNVPLGDEHAIDIAEYLDPQRFERERDVEFRTRVNLVAHSSEVAKPGAFVTRDVVDTPVLIARGDDGIVRAFLNVCRHRGATVELRERGQCKRFVCPYHAWSYDRCGSLVSVRHREGFPSLRQGETGLVELSCEERGGLIWVCPDPTCRGVLDPDCCELLDEVAALGPEHPHLYARESRVWRANWKLIVEGGLESYHFKIAHRNTVGSLFTDTGSIYEGIGDHVRLVLPRTTMASLREVPEAEWNLLEHANVLYTLVPNASILVQNGHYVLIVLHPLAVDATRVELATVSRMPGDNGYSTREQEFLHNNHTFTVRTLHEDFTIAEQIQRGLATGANQTLRFARFESALRDFHAGLERRLRSASHPATQS